MRQLMILSLLCGGVLFSFDAARADVTPEQKKELLELYKSLREKRGLVKKREFAELRKVVEEAEAKLKEIGLAEEDQRDRNYRNAAKQLNYLREAIPVSFEKQIAPIIKDKCLRCHGEARQSARLRLDTFNQMARGGANGALVRGNNPRNSLLVARLVTPDAKLRMPKNGAALAPDQIQLIAKWVSQGAPYDGTDRDSTIGTAAADKPKKEPFKAALPDGSETVSFKDDIAPWMVGGCMGCHGDRNPRNGYSISTFEKLMTTGESGPVVVPGNPDDSYIVDLTLRQKPLKMPPGNQTRIKKSQAEALATWIKEGAKFDGGDQSAPIRSLVPTPAELEAMKLAAMSDAEFSARRLEQGKEMWERVLPRDEVLHVETDNFYVFGTDDSRLKEVSQWAEADLAEMKKYFGFEGAKAWRGKLNIFVAKDRFGYSEFNQVVFNRETPKEMIGHAVVTAGFDQAYVALHDIGNVVDESSPGMRTNVTAQVTEAFLQRTGNAPPRIIARGVGLLMASKSIDKEDPWFGSLRGRMKSAVVTKPAEVFDDGAFSRSELDGFALAMAKFLVKAGKPKFMRLIKEFQSGAKLQPAIRKVYGRTPGQVGGLFLKSLR